MPGITPADAGKTHYVYKFRGSPGDHPRGCGENRPLVCFISILSGSPPRMRGKLGVRARCRLHGGITPADAGKTLSERVRVRSCWDHPRGCGENLPDFKFSGDVKGSPPRMRGKRLAADYHVDSQRITPADAGKTQNYNGFPIVPWDHPRGCGENVADKQHGDAFVGSPPRMRGKLQAHESSPEKHRITPADAGKTRLRA